MISELQKLLHRLTGGRPAEPVGSSPASTETAGSPTDGTMKVEVEKPSAMDQGKAVILPNGAVVVKAPKYPEADLIAASIRDFPEDWSWKLKGYELQHVPTGFVMWVANKEFALAEVCSGGGKFEFSEPERAIIWPAVEAWLARHKVGFTGRLPKVHIHFANGHWWCLGKGHPWAGAGDSPAGAYRSWSRAVSIQARTYTTPNEVLHVWSAAR